MSPYESAWVGISSRLFQQPAHEMSRLLRRFDVTLDDKFREPADHLCVELALFGRLIRWNASRASQIELLDDHLLSWVPGFASRCHEADSTGFYAGAATVLSGFLIDQRAILHSGEGPTECPVHDAEPTNN